MYGAYFSYYLMIIGVGIALFVRGRDQFAERIQAGVRLIQQANAGGSGFAEIMRGNIGGHANGDAGRAV